MQSIAETCVRFDAAHLSINLVSEIAVPMFTTLRGYAVSKTEILRDILLFVAKIFTYFASRNFISFSYLFCSKLCSQNLWPIVHPEDHLPVIGTNVSLHVAMCTFLLS